MNRVSGALALIAVAAASVAAAQSTPPQSTRPSDPMPSTTQYPSSTAQPPASSQTRTADSTSASARADRKQQIKDCMAQQKANNSGMSRHEMKKYCKNQVDGSSPPQG